MGGETPRERPPVRVCGGSPAATKPASSATHRAGRVYNIRLHHQTRKFMAAVDRPSRPELLAPAGDWEAMRAAVANGADAVYFGLSELQRPAPGGQFHAGGASGGDAVSARAQCAGVSSRFNTLIFSDELEEAVGVHRRRSRRPGPMR